MAEVKKKFTLYDSDPNVTEDSTFGATWRDTWSWQCPDHLKVLLQPGDEFSLKAYDSSDVEYVAPDALVEVLVRSAGGEVYERIYGPANYTSSADFQDHKKIRKLQLDHPILVKPRDKIVFRTYDSTGMDAASVANSYCRLVTTKIVEEK
uniref:Uncharacterized protein n=1 Tax=viral metagenome TaxID=1070528 RepID=A0A6M3JS21_9ZZZZ